MLNVYLFLYFYTRTVSTNNDANSFHQFLVKNYYIENLSNTSEFNWM